MFKKLILFFALLATPALAQNVQQSGSVTAGHIPWWVTSGVIGDGGSSVDSPITSIGVTNNGGAGICVSSARQTAAGRNQLCFGASTNAPATISLQNYGTATPQGLNFILNGVVVSLPSGGGTFITGSGVFTPGDVPCFLSSAGVIQDCGLAVSNGTITTGVWHGTPIAINEGGTGATAAAGARTNLGLGTLSLQDASAVAITGGTITGMPTPTVASDVAIKSYVDATATGLNILAPSTLATAAVLPNTPTYSNGTAGVGATLTAGSNTTLTVDGTAAPLNTVVLVKNQASAFQNGIYTVTTAGSGAAPWVLTRATYFDQAAEMKSGSYTFISGGTTNLNTSYILQTAVTTVGTDPLNWVQFSAAASGTVTSATIAPGTGISATGTCTITSAGTCTVATSPGVDANTLNTVTANYTIQTSDCGSTIQAGTGATGLFTITLPAVSGFSAICTINIKNGNSGTTGRGQVLAGFPADLNNVLWPTQALTVKIVNGVWATINNPGRWLIPGSRELCVRQDGSSVTDGLGDGTVAADCLNLIQTAVTRIGTQWDGGGYNSCSIGLYAGGTNIFNESVNQTGQSIGCYLTYNVRGNIKWTGTSSCLNAGDNSVTIINWNLGFVPTFSCNTNNVASIGQFKCHQTCIYDFNGGTAIWLPGGNPGVNTGSNDVFFDVDLQGSATFNAQVNVGDGINTFAPAAFISCEAHCSKVTASGTVAYSAHVTTGAAFILRAGSVISTNLTWLGANVLNPTAVTGNSVLLTNGTSVPPSAPTTASGGQVCTSAC